MAKVAIKNGLILGLASWLNELNLSGYHSRERSRFVTQLADRLKETEGFRQELIQKYAKKDDKGAPIKTEDGTSYVLDDVEKFKEELTDLYQDEFEINLPDKTFKTLKDIILNTYYTFGPKEGDNEQERQAKVRQANDYSAWCEVFEK